MFDLVRTRERRLPVALVYVNVEPEDMGLEGFRGAAGFPELMLAQKKALARRMMRDIGQEPTALVWCDGGGCSDGCLGAFIAEGLAPGQAFYIDFVPDPKAKVQVEAVQLVFA